MAAAALRLAVPIALRRCAHSRSFCTAATVTRTTIHVPMTIGRFRCGKNRRLCVKDPSNRG